jgi:hypothetical protein
MEQRGRWADEDAAEAAADEEEHEEDANDEEHGEEEEGEVLRIVAADRLIC